MGRDRGGTAGRWARAAGNGSGAVPRGPGLERTARGAPGGAAQDGGGRWAPAAGGPARFDLRDAAGPGDHRGGEAAVGRAKPGTAQGGARGRFVRTAVESG